MRACALILFGVAVLAACSQNSRPSLLKFAGMDQEDRDAAWAKMTPADRRILNCQADAWIAYRDAKSGLASGTSGPREWAGTNANWIDYATFNVPGMKECEEIS